MRSLLDVQDELNTARNFVECAFLACHELPPEQGDPLCAVLDAASDRLQAIGEVIKHLGHTESSGGNRTANR